MLETVPLQVFLLLAAINPLHIVHGIIRFSSITKGIIRKFHYTLWLNVLDVSSHTLV